MRILVTGGAGFIGTNLVYHLAGNGHHLINFDALTYAGNLANLDGIDDEHHTFVRGDVADPVAVRKAFEKHEPQAVMHLAAESHVDRSIDAPSEFVRTNVLGTQVMLDAAKQFGVEKFVHVSTDEVYGALGKTGLFTEDTPLAPNSPYSASKASSDLLARAYFHTFELPVCITRCSNNYGPYQFPEKLIPLFSTNAMKDKPLPLYGRGENVRDWIHVSDHCQALETVLLKGEPGQVYNIGGNCEKTNLEITQTILAALGKSDDLIRFVSDRPAHDFRYAIDSSKIKSQLGWEPTIEFEKGIADTIKWYQEKQDWWEQIKSGAYRDYYEQMYGQRLKEQ